MTQKCMVQVSSRPDSDALKRNGMQRRAMTWRRKGIVRSGKRPNADIEEGHKSTRLCHLGNAAYRVGRALRFDAATETFPGDAEANRLLSRTYRKPFVMPDKV